MSLQQSQASESLGRHARGSARAFRSLEALPASSSTSAVRYSAGEEVSEFDVQAGALRNAPRMAALYTAAVAPTRPPEAARDC